MVFHLNAVAASIQSNSTIEHSWHTLKVHYRAQEQDLVMQAVKDIVAASINKDAVDQHSRDLIEKVRAKKIKTLSVEGMMHMHKLSSKEGLSLMCLAEALLRIPDEETRTQFILDKLNNGDWANSATPNTMAHMTNWGLGFSQKLLSSPLKKYSSGFIRASFQRAMRLMGSQFVLGETMERALKRARIDEKKNYTHSYDMLGEGAKTAHDAKVYLQAYKDAIEKLGVYVAEHHATTPIEKRPSISVKLSAIHPRYELFQHDRVMAELYPNVLALCEMAQNHGIALTIDAEETERLELSLELIERLMSEASLKNWHGLGLAVQAYQKRATYVLDFLTQAARHHKVRLCVRLVKGAYWDSEIKKTQERGLDDYPVFTQKHHTDVNYQACALKMLQSSDCLYPQFATHNAQTIGFILQAAQQLGVKNYEFQRLHGMGAALHDALLSQNPDVTSRIYAPVGVYKDLLAYLVRRLLENGANSSFVNMVYDENIPVDYLIQSPLLAAEVSKGLPHPKIKTPDNLYQERLNSKGFDVSDTRTLKFLNAHAESFDLKSIVVISSTEETLVASMEAAAQAHVSWSKQPVANRADAVEKLGHLMQQHAPMLCKILTEEAGKTINDAIAEIREAIDFCYYYGRQAIKLQSEPLPLPGPTGEKNQLMYTARGVYVAIAPWNFPLAIFIGQAMAAVVTGNAVVAKCASQTPKIVTYVHQLGLEAGIPREIFQLAIAPGSLVSKTLLKSKHLSGVVFTGSTETAQHINHHLAKDHLKILPLIAETGGLNAMIVDASALPEQVVQDVITSAFQSAGQRCSALRLLVIQDDIADRVLEMLKGAMDQLVIGDPSDFSTDVGPVIDAVAHKGLTAYVNEMTALSEQGTVRLLHAIKLPESCGLPNLIAPQVWQIPSVRDLTREIFGPILHVVRYKAGHLENVVADINASQYGLTLGVHSRLDSTIDYVTHNAHAGNIYINRNMIGAVVGVQPFGGEGLSGTGFKAGGPNYLLKFLHERTITQDTTATGGNATLLAEI